MTASLMRAVWNRPVEIATALLFVCALLYIGKPSGAAVILVALGMPGAVLALLEIHDWISGDRQMVAATRAEASNPDEKSEWHFATFMAIFMMALVQIFWCCAAFIPDPNFGGDVVTTPMAWLMANVMALPTALVAYDRSPRKIRNFLTAGTGASVTALLLLSSFIPFMLAR
jgi:hypothetical protein